MQRLLFRLLLGLALALCCLVFARAQALDRPAARPKTYPEKEFVIKAVRVIGNTLLAESEIQGITSRYIGKKIDLKTLQQIALELTNLYRKKKYLLARAIVPPQDIKNGIVQILMVEGQIEKIKIKGNNHYSSSFIRYFLSPAIQRGFLQSEKFEKALILLNEFTDLNVHASLKAGEKSGTSDLILEVQDKTPFHTGLDYNNFGSRFTGRNRAGLEVWHGSLTGRGDLFDVRSVLPFPSASSPFLQAYYTIPASSSGTKLTASYLTGNLLAGEELQVLDIRGLLHIYGFSVSQPLNLTTTVESHLTGNFYWKNSQNFFETSILTSRDKIRSIVSGYDRQWVTHAAKDFFAVSMTQGLGTWLGGMAKGDSFSSRQGASNLFTKMNADLVHIQRIFSGKFLLLRGSSQYAMSPLTVTEQFPLGGPDSVRGYEQSELLGDSGWNLSAELRIPLLGQDNPNHFQAAFFVDTGYVSLKNPLSGETGKEHLTGTGAGIRAGLSQSTSFRVDLGFPLDPPNNASHEYPVLYAQFATQF